MNRIDRLTAIIILLQSKKIIKAAEIAERFTISLRTVYRDMRALEEAGVPLGSEAGTGYFLAQGYHLPPVMFTTQEASAMLTAEKLVEKFTDLSVNRNYKLAIDKVKAILPLQGKDFFESLQPKVEILFNPQITNDSPMPHYMIDIQQAISTSQKISIDYKSAYNDTLTRNRKVEPIGLLYYSFAWHMIGYCQLRNDYRDFRLDRIKNLTLLKERINADNKLSLKEYLTILQQTEDLSQVTVRFEKSVLKEIENTKLYYGFVNQTETKNSIEMNFMTNSFEYIGKWLITLGNKVEVIRPEGFKKLIYSYVEELKHHYS
ncbi:MAG: YafY family transcriptional regulator [Bacteroidales bacterium]|nr:YafY family transcriptional regulator [Bacteroidales bacterium]